VREEGGDIRVHVYAHDLPIGQVNLHLGLATGSSIPKINTARMQWYERVFASYAHEDFAIVEWYRDLCKDLEITMFVDKSGLQAGEPWEGTLLKQIRASDIFYLFWSRAARRSKYVTREWHAALDLIHVKGETFLRPMFWESPMPIAPSKLAPFHFRQISLGGHADIGRPDVSPDDSHDPKRELRTKKINQAMETGAKKQRGSSPKR